MTPADVFFGRAKEVENYRAAVKRKTLQLRRAQYLMSNSSFPS